MQLCTYSMDNTEVLYIWWSHTNRYGEEDYAYQPYSCNRGPNPRTVSHTNSYGQED
jgi:hypothetical protein